MRHLGRATSSSSYGGYGGSDKNYRYAFDYPEAWKPITVSKTMKATNGTDAKFGDGKSAVYAVSFVGYPALKEDRRSIISDLALSDSAVQDALSFADEVLVSERTIDGQAYASFDIISGPEAYYVAVTCDGSRLYGLFAVGKTGDERLLTARDSLRSLQKASGGGVARFD